MKHIQSFERLNESREDAQAIMDFVHNSPEGKDLLVILGENLADPTKSLDPKRTGRIYVLGAGAKTYMGKSHSGKYHFESVFGGKTYGTEFFDSVKDLIRGLCINVVGKRLELLGGFKREDIIKWAGENVPLG